MWDDILISVYIGLSASVAVFYVLHGIHGAFLFFQAKRREEAMLAEVAEELRQNPPPPYDPVKAEERRIELLAAGFREASPGIFTFPAHPIERARYLETLRDRCHYVRQPRCGTASTP